MPGIRREIGLAVQYLAVMRFNVISHVREVIVMFNISWTQSSIFSVHSMKQYSKSTDM